MKRMIMKLGTVGAAVLGCTALANGALAWQTAQTPNQEVLTAIANARPGATIVVPESFDGQLVITGKHFSSPITIRNNSSLVQAVVIRDCSNIIVEGGAVIGGTGVAYAVHIDRARSVTVRGMKMTNAIRAVVINQSEAVGIFSNRMTGLRSDGVNIAASRQVVVEGNSCASFNPIKAIYDAAGKLVQDGDHPDCIQSWSVPGSPPNSDIVIRGNSINGEMQAIFFGNKVRNGVDDGGFDRITIENNYVNISYGNGIRVESGRGVNIVANEVRTIPGSVLPNGSGILVKANITAANSSNVVACDNIIQAVPTGLGTQPCTAGQPTIPAPPAPPPEPVAAAPAPTPEPVAAAPAPTPEPVAAVPAPAPEPVAAAPAPAPEPVAAAPAPAPEPIAAAPAPTPEPAAAAPAPAPEPVAAAPAPAPTPEPAAAAPAPAPEPVAAVPAPTPIPVAAPPAPTPVPVAAAPAPAPQPVAAAPAPTPEPVAAAPTPTPTAPQADPFAPPPLVPLGPTTPVPTAQAPSATTPRAARMNGRGEVDAVLANVSSSFGGAVTATSGTSATTAPVASAPAPTRTTSKKKKAKAVPVSRVTTSAPITTSTFTATTPTASAPAAAIAPATQPVLAVVQSIIAPQQVAATPPANTRRQAAGRGNASAE